MAIAKTYANISGGGKGEEILRRAMDYSIDTINKTKEAETAFRLGND
jgi:hypothetical protein